MVGKTKKDARISDESVSVVVPYTRDWRGCYDGSWRGMIVGDACGHPARMAYGLLTRIIEHGLGAGWWRFDDVVGDPFAGVGSTGMIAAYHGLRSVGVELELCFVGWAERNLGEHRRSWARLGCPQPRVIKGDSREFARLVGEVNCVVTSPPYEDAVSGGGDRINWDKIKGGGTTRTTARGAIADGYGHTTGQIGSTSNDTYWTAMHDVYAQCRIALKPGGVMAVVVKDYVKAGQRVPFCQDTITLLESLGFEIIERIRAWVGKSTTHPGLFGDVTEVESRKSFFRHLAESKGGPPIDWEEVIVVRV